MCADTLLDTIVVPTSHSIWMGRGQPMCSRGCGLDRGAEGGIELATARLLQDLDVAFSELRDHVQRRKGRVTVALPCPRSRVVRCRR